MAEPTHIRIKIFCEDNNDIKLFFMLNVPITTSPYDATNLIAEKLLEPTSSHCVLLVNNYAFMHYISETDEELSIRANSHKQFQLGHIYKFFVVRKVNRLLFFNFFDYF